jgi:cyclopropane fatty-acyl-phospholipid synthase-like methyltransferase
MRPDPVAALYEHKTRSILQRYGPGPRVHYHTGFVNDSELATTPAALRALLVESQEQMLKYAAHSWKLRSIEFLDVLDVGCGLGGSAIFFAQEFGARVTAVTIAPSHIELIAGFARQAGVESRVIPLLCEASAVPGHECFDAAIAIESSSLFSREPWFDCLARIVRPGGHVFVFDCFLRRSEYEAPFNRHWCARIGTEEEYVTAARQSGFRFVAREDVSFRTATFWKSTLQLIHAEARETRPDSSQLQTIEESLETHEVMLQGLLDGGLRQLNMTFIKV